MRLNEVTYTDAEPVDGYGSGFFRVGGKRVDGALITGPAGTGGWGGLEDRQVLLDLAGCIDVLLIGTGAEIAHIPVDLRRAIEDAGMGVETMNSPAACRTYNVLLTEGRRVALAVLPI